jgi:hypothetical protein
VTAVEDAAAEAGGIVSGENTSTDPSTPRRSSAHLTLRVPTDNFRDLMSSVAAVGKRVSQSQSAEDVTGQVVDTQSRLATQKRSVARVRALLAEAKTIGQVVQVESELSRREADLESLESQLAQLRDVADLATLDVQLLGPTAPPAKKKETDDNLGFLAGLKSGLSALVALVVVALTVVGAVLPFALATALVGLPLWILLRPRLRRRVSPTVPVP